MKRFVIALAVFATVVGGVACSAGNDGGGNIVRIGTSEAGKESWDVFVDEARKAGITLVTTNFTDFSQPNVALTQKQIDVNLFQHLRFLAEYNVADNATLVPVGATYIVPLGLYSQKYKAIADIPQGGQIAIPNDPPNQARALFVLKAAGLIALTGGRRTPSTADIDKGASRVTVTLVDAAQTALSLTSIDGAVINNTYLAQSNIDPKSALYSDDPASAAAEPYINVLVARAEEKDNPTYQRLIEVFHSRAVTDAYAKESKGTQRTVNKSGADCAAILARIQDQIRAEK
ncbi:methionine ABC transporter substrate-binding protein [Mycobacterium sp. CBMA271]|uniref:MetQ/NlpA family ABC transporter substrate-binding protein n=1 Tax=unclassified Mycobacteroides TaxID=2618759 RepID=UPI00132B9AE3|nr:MULTISPECIES: MetQ/NlpA family ABC transporter substrate-binding protein [unclassified Mycobacteroides]MUM18404.1 methionine ABC transporter substrate-binding protein [Mycobacteroides sp. CBMA 326]MUM23674.1 methionine ABC transporter substrate-binding protein [Mycobacteroides sp. CBMA 271]